MIEFTPENIQKWAKIGIKKVAYVPAAEICQTHENAVFLSADVGRRFDLDRLPAGRYIDVGISEQAMIGIAAGLAAEGYRPFVAAYSPFVTARVLDFVRIFCGDMRMPLVIAGADAGLSAADLGPALTSLSDIADMRAVPHMAVVEPADCAEAVKAFLAAADWDGPVFLRLVGGPNQAVVHESDFTFEIGKARVEREGADTAIVAAGAMVHASLRAAELLEQRGVSCRVLNMHTVKPLDTAALDALVSFPCIATCEEHSVLGGLGGAVAEYYAAKRVRPRQLLLGVPDTFYAADTRRNVLGRAGLSAEQIAERVLKFLREE